VQWIVTESENREAVQYLIKVLHVPWVISKILVSRGITSFEQAQEFFRADWENLYDPFLMKDMHKATERAAQALEKHECIFIYGDYDVDGITSVSLLTLFFKKNGGDVVYYIPNRLEEGYGLSEAGIKRAAENGADLLISVDCGITALEEVNMANSHGIDVIICDHHEPGQKLPNAVAILNPKQKECGYPFKELAGVGVAYKLIQAISNKLNLNEEEHRKYIDLVALGSAADIVPMVDENRLLVKKGLERLNRLEHLGIRSLIKTAGLEGRKIGTGQVVFMLAPRINAVGRLGNAERAVRLLMSESEVQTREIAHIMEVENRSRKNIDEEIFFDAMSMVESQCDIRSDKAFVLAQDGWHSGVIGIVASRIVEQYFRPTVMIAINNGVGKGSARSIPNFDIYAALKRCADYLISYGGHRYAAGLTIRSDHIDGFRKNFKEVTQEMIGEDDLIQKLFVDSEIRLSDINQKLVRLLDLFAPFGPKNLRPQFLSRNLQVVGSPRIVGSNHLKFKVRQDDEVFDAIGFNLGSLLYRLAPGENNLDMVYMIEENQWNGYQKIQLRVKDLR